MEVEILQVDARDAATMLGISERSFYDLLKREPDLARRARVVMSARMTRYRVSALKEWLASLPDSRPTQRPSQLAAGKAAELARREEATAS